MGIVSDVALSEIIVSLANAVSAANTILNNDPQAKMAITRFEVNTNFTAVLSVSSVAKSAVNRTPVYNLRREPTGLYRLADYVPAPIQEARFAQLLQPDLREAMLPSTQTTTAQVEIKAVIEAVPTIEKP